MIKFYLAQCFGLIALLFVCLSYYKNSKLDFFKLQILSNIFYACSFLVLGVFVGGINTVISILRVCCLYICYKLDKKPSKLLFLFFVLLYILFGIICYQNIFDILAIVSYQFFNFAMFVPNMQKTRLLMLFPNFLIVIYNILNMTYTNAILDMMEIVVLFGSIIKYHKLRIKN